MTIAEGLCRKRKPLDAIPYLTKVMEDPNNLDADIQFCFLQPNLTMSMQVLEHAEQKGIFIRFTQYDVTYLKPRSYCSLRAVGSSYLR